MSWKYALFVSSFYVLSLYILVPSNVKILPRENQLHMKYRMAAVSFATIVDVFVAFMIYPNFFLKLAFLPIFQTVSCCLVTSLLMVIFYLGPFTTSMLLLQTQSHWNISPFGVLREKTSQTSLLSELHHKVSSEWLEEEGIVLFRNLVFAPVTEEIVFRGLVVSFLFIDLEPSNVQYFKLALSSTIYFGVAHVHHLYEKIRFGNQSLNQAIISTLIQFLYTSIFGFIASLLFIRTGNIFSPIISHMICNYAGLPNLGFMQSGTNPYSALFSNRFLLLGLHAVGLALFSVLLYPFTSGFTSQSVFIQE